MGKCRFGAGEVAQGGLKQAELMDPTGVDGVR